MSEEKKIIKAYLGLGSNIGDREKHLSDAIEKIGSLPDITISKESSIYLTKPVGYEKQDDFLNMVIEISTKYPPEILLEHMQKTENSMMRKREVRWGPRTIDIDILLYNDLKIVKKNLIIPHERLFMRAFVLVPLMEIYSGSKSYDFKAFLKKTDDRNSIFLYKKERE